MWSRQWCVRTQLRAAFHRARLFFTDAEGWPRGPLVGLMALWQLQEAYLASARCAVA